MSQSSQAGRDFERARLSRRSLLACSAAFAATTSVGLVPTTAFGQEPSRGGSARFGMSDGSQNDSLDPAGWPTTFTEAAFSGSLCNNLTEILPDGTIVGDLAENFESSDGAKKWLFKIRKGVTFHDGKILTPRDVIETFRYHTSEKSTSGAKPILSQVTDIAQDGEDNVVFTLDSGSADFPYLVADFHLSIMQAKSEGGIDWQKGVGTGAFRLENFDPGASCKMTRNPNYHKNNKPYLDEVEFVCLLDPTARTNALLTGEIDYMIDLDAKSIPLVERNPDLEVQRVPSLRHWAFDMDTSVAPFNNPDVRLALKYAIDREDILRKAFFGEGKTGNDSPVAAGMPFYKDPAPRFNYDIGKAKALLAKAGLTSLDVNLSVADSAFPGCIDAAVLYKEHAAKAGININIIREADDGYYDNIWLKKPFCGVDWYGRPTCDWLFSTVLATDAPWNDTHWKNQRFNELLVAARAETDQSRRATQYGDMQQIIHDDGGMLVLAFVNWDYGLSKKLKHGDIGGTFPCDNFRMAERWWRA